MKGSSNSYTVQSTENALPSFFLSTRFGLAILGFFGLLTVYSLRVNLSLALVCMVNNTALNQMSLASNNISSDVHSECFREVSNSTKPQKEGEFAWNKETIGLILGSFFWGYLLTQVLGGMAAQRYGAKRVFGYTVLVGCILTLLTPLAARLSYICLIALRIILGLCQAVTFPCMHTLWTHWSPPLERSRLTGLTYAGAQVGNVITLPISGVLCDHGFAGGWPSVFYVLGMCSFVYFLAWMILVSDSPQTHPRISQAERNFIVNSLSHQLSDSDQVKKHKPPWPQILTSLPVWACIVGHVAGDWAAYTMLTCLPSFMKEVLGFDYSALGFLAAIPYIAYFVCINLGGVIADAILKNRILSIVNTRRLMMVIALASQALFLVAAGYCTCGQEYIVMALLTIGLGLSGFQYAGFIVNYMEIAPQYAGTIVGVGNTLSCLGGILAPVAMGVLTPNKTREEWLTLFYLTAAILVAGVIFFVVFASGEIQDWAKKEMNAEIGDMNGDTSMMKEMEPLDRNGKRSPDINNDIKKVKMIDDDENEDASPLV